MFPLTEQTAHLRLVRRPSRDEREESCAELRDDEGRVVALVEEIPAEYVH